MPNTLIDTIAAGIRQYCSDLNTEYGYHEPTLDTSLLQRFHDDAASIADYIVSDGLDFVEERRTLTDGWIQPTRNAMYFAVGQTPPPAVITNEHRYVSSWVQDA